MGPVEVGGVGLAGAFGRAEAAAGAEASGEGAEDLIRRPQAEPAGW